MFNYHLIPKMALSGLAFAGLLVLSYTPPVHAQVCGAAGLPAPCIRTGDIKTGAVKSPQIGNQKVRNIKLFPDAVTTDKILNRTIQGVDIGINQVGSDEVSGLRDFDIVDEAGVDSEQFTFIGDDVALTTAWQDAHNIAITHPTSGVVTCISTGAMDWQNSTQRFAEAGWSTATGNVAPSVFNFAQPNSTSTGGPEIPISAVHTFNVSGSGTTTFRLKVRITAGNAGDVWYWRQSAACMFFPTRY